MAKIGKGLQAFIAGQTDLPKTAAGPKQKPVDDFGMMPTAAQTERDIARDKKYAPMQTQLFMEQRRDPEKEMALERARNAQVESNVKRMGTGLRAMLEPVEKLGKATRETLSTVRDVYAEMYKDPDFGGKWGAHALANEDFANILADKKLPEPQRFGAYSFAGGYDFVRKFPDSGVGAEVLAALYQTRDAAVSGTKALITGKGLKAMTGAVAADVRGGKGNLAGIKAAQEDLAKGELKDDEALLKYAVEVGGTIK